MPVSKLHFARCSHCGIDGRVVEQAIDGRCCDISACLERVRSLPSPFDPNPRALEPAQNGFRWCHSCQSVAEVAGHECAKPFGTLTNQATAQDWSWLAEREGRRADFAESLLCAMALQHGFERMDPYDMDDEEIARVGRGAWMWPGCDAGDCPFCDAARGGAQ